MNIRPRRVRLLVPAGLILALTGVLVSTLLTGVSTGVYAASAAPERSRDYEIQGREYEEDRIIYDVPKRNRPSRDAAVVYFPNNAVIPSYINVEGVRYTVREIREGAARTDIDDPDGRVTLPPTLKRAILSKSLLYCDNDGFYTGYTYGVQNVYVTNLDSFLNMDRFDQTYNRGAVGFKPGNWKGNWKLHLNGEELRDFDYVFPEGSPMGTNLMGLTGVRSITIPASDTARTTHLYWSIINSWETKPFPQKLRFRADSGYNTRFYDILTDTIVLPKNMTEFNGLGFDWNQRFDTVAIIWPDNLKTVASTKGLRGIRIEDLPGTVIHVGNDLKREKTCEFSAEETVTVPRRLKTLENVVFVSDTEEGIKETVIEDSDEPLYISGNILLTDAVDSQAFYIGRSLVDKDDDSHFTAYVENQTATVTIGEKVAMLPADYPIDLRYKRKVGDKIIETLFKPQYLICRGLTPPEFRDPYFPDILYWKLQTVLVVPEEAEEAYRNHPVWKQFRTIQTTEADSITMDNEVVSEQWFSLDGRKLSSPQTGRINILVTTYSDGTVQARKVAVP